ncbi:hypothetical protein KSF73_09605 [Burkholderiaceae bacterium DAT-1]|nr:hypothetical protein [Burkholderiaceae bacterium DAT-1]
MKSLTLTKRLVTITCALIVSVVSFAGTVEMFELNSVAKASVTEVRA